MATDGRPAPLWNSAHTLRTSKGLAGRQPGPRPLTPQGGCTGMLGPGNLDQEWIFPFAWVLSLTPQMYAQSTQLDELIIAVLSPSSHFIILGFFDDFSII